MISRMTPLATKELDPRGAGLVEEIFGWFEERGDRVARIIFGGAKHLKVFQHHDCFEPCLPDELPRDDEGSIPKGRIFGARVYRSKQLEPNIIIVEGERLEPGGRALNVVQFVEKRR
ncbi:MAG TPA: hypothetical protein VFF73_04840 [Planctomycetota bacterium]|nr:hypothetical protein [Planctomycetota bacterium]